MAFTKLRDIIDLATEISASSAGLTMMQMMERSERSRRTVERMLAGLDGLGIETETNLVPGEHHLLKRWRLAKPLPAPLIALGERERLALEGVAATMASGAARHALVRLLASQRSGIATSVAVDAHTLIDRTAYTGFVGPRYIGNENLIGQLERAIQGFDELKVAYRKDGEALASTARVKPLGLLFGRFGYLVGLASGKGVRTYRLNCIEDIALAGKTFTPPTWFNLKAWAAESFGIYHGDELKTWRIVFSPKVAERAASVQFHPSQVTERLPDGSLLVHVRCRGHQELLWEIGHPDWAGEVRVAELD